MIFVNPANPKGIVWIASYPKSGNTWIRVFLYHLMRLQGGHPREDDEINKLDRASTYEGRLFGLFEEFLGKKLETATREEVTNVRPQVHAPIAQRCDGLALVKTHNLLGQISGISTVNLSVSAGTIYIVRDPRDIAPSLAHHLGIPIDHAITVMGTSGYKNDNSAESAFEIWGAWDEHVYSWTAQPHEAVIVLRYEDLIADPVRNFTAAVQHIRQSPTPEQIAEAVELSSFERLREAEKQGDFRERSERADRFFRQGAAGGWRQSLTDAQAERIVERHREQMTRFGYLPQ